MRRVPRSDRESSPPGRSWHPLRRRLAVLAAAPLLALSAATATAQGVWVTVPNLPTPRFNLDGAAADCPEGLIGTCVYAIGGAVDGDRNEVYSPSSGTWATLAPLKTPRRGVASTTAPCPGGVEGDCVYVLGGNEQGGPALNTAEAYSTAANVWLSLPPVQTRRTNAAAATAPCPGGLPLRGTCVYVFGGSNEDVPSGLTSVEAYSPATNTWATLKDLQTGRHSHGGAAAPCPGDLGLRANCVYAVGGTAAGGSLDSVEVYSPLLDAWQFAPDLPAARTQLGAATAPCPEGMSDGCVYAVGGGGSPGAETKVEAYTPVSNVWVTLPSLPTPHRGLASATAPCPRNTRNTCVYAFGGSPNGAESLTPAVEAFAIEGAHGRPAPRPEPEQRPEQRPEPEQRPDQKPAPAPKPDPKPAPKPTPKPAPSEDPSADPDEGSPFDTPAPGAASGRG
ncbi:kelch repeat-containing protein [Streptomyces xanthophaeus]|uniref:Kelch repeat-containing protein n=1 Tax=Streptomyces xanthophaeus TaxID=67385 RepID=UPI0039901162